MQLLHREMQKVFRLWQALLMILRANFFTIQNIYVDSNSTSSIACILEASYHALFKSVWGCYNQNRYYNPVYIYLFKVNNRNTRKRYEICSELTIKTPERPQWRHSGFVIVNFEPISHLFLVSNDWLWTSKYLLGIFLSQLESVSVDISLSSWYWKTKCFHDQVSTWLDSKHIKTVKLGIFLKQPFSYAG